MTDHTATLILLGTTVANGLLAGASLDQSIKQLPARKRMGPSMRQPPPQRSPNRR